LALLQQQCTVVNGINCKAGGGQPVPDIGHNSTDYEAAR
jgi:hypothetical protein